MALTIQQAIEELKNDKTVSVKAFGHSMEPRIKSGETVTVVPITSRSPKKGDAVIAVVNGRTYLHLVKAVKAGQVLIGNNKGHVNGWTSKVYGVVVSGGIDDEA